MVENKIIQLINASLATVTNVPVITPENKTYKPTQRTPYIRPTILPSEPVQTTIGYDRTVRWTGLYQLDYFYPANTGAESDIAARIVEHFHTNRFLNDGEGFQVTIVMSWRATANTLTDWYRIPIMLRYETFTQQN